jgi:hypothetical protein
MNIRSQVKKPLSPALNRKGNRLDRMEKQPLASWGAISKAGIRKRLNFLLR